MSKGKVYITGAGPGDETLLTLKAVEALKKCDAVVYDYLAAIDLNKYAPQAENHFVGKTGDVHPIKQSKKNELLIKLAKEGKKVVRFKGGDPFIFGRGGEEALALMEAGIDFEIIPGITSAYSAPAYAGIPTTQRGYASMVTFVTGHEDPKKAESGIDWKLLAQGGGTIIFMMGIKNLSKIITGLTENGKNKKTPVALVGWGTTNKQKVLEATLADIVKKAQIARFKAPAIIVIGEVVKLRSKLKWFEKKPLFGKTVVVTRSRAQASNLSQALRENGASVIEIPTIKVVPPDNFELADKAIDKQASKQYYDWIIFTSVNGVNYFIEALKKNDTDFRIFNKTKIAAIGSQTAASLKSLSLNVDLVPNEYVAEGILKEIGDVSGKKILIPRAKIAREILPKAFRKGGALVDVVEVYQNIANTSVSKENLKAVKESANIITFTSSSTVTNFLNIIAGDKEILNNIKIATIGPITSKTVKENGLNVDIEAKEHTISGLVKAIVEDANESQELRG